MAGQNSTQVADLSFGAHKAVLLSYLQDIELQFNRVDAVAFAARRMHEANRGDDDYDPTNGRLFEIIEHEVEDRGTDALLDQLIAGGFLMCGNPEEVSEQLESYKSVGCDQLCIGMPQDLVKAYIERHCA